MTRRNKPMDNKNLLDIFVKERLCKVLTDIKKLNADKIDRDIALILNGEDYNVIFDGKPKEIEIQLSNKVRELNILIVCAKFGFDYFMEKELPKYKNFLSEKEYNETVEYFKEILELEDIDLSGEVN
jgi:hypothetical protein